MMGPPTFSARHGGAIDFAYVNARARAVLPALVARWLPDGVQCGREWSAKNPRRADRRAGSFKVNILSGAWADFATGERGGDPISLYAYLTNSTQGEAARQLGDMLGVPRNG